MNSYWTLLLLILPVASLASFESLPFGWRVPTESEVSSEPMRNWSPSGFIRVDGDFNSDGIMDYAHLLKSKIFDGEGFAVFLSSPSGHSWKVIDQFEYRKQSSKPRLYMGLDIVKPGSIKTACGKGYWKCAKSEPELLQLNSTGISYFKFESASSIWFWNKSENNFSQVWISD